MIYNPGDGPDVNVSINARYNMITKEGSPYIQAAFLTGLMAAGFVITYMTLVANEPGNGFKPNSNDGTRWNYFEFLIRHYPNRVKGTGDHYISFYEDVGRKSHIATLKFETQDELIRAVAGYEDTAEILRIPEANRLRNVKIGKGDVVYQIRFEPKSLLQRSRQLIRTNPKILKEITTGGASVLPRELIDSIRLSPS